MYILVFAFSISLSVCFPSLSHHLLPPPPLSLSLSLSLFLSLSPPSLSTLTAFDKETLQCCRAILLRGNVQQRVATLVASLQEPLQPRHPRHLIQHVEKSLRVVDERRLARRGLRVYHAAKTGEQTRRRRHRNRALSQRKRPLSELGRSARGKLSCKVIQYPMTRIKWPRPSGAYPAGGRIGGGAHLCAPPPYAAHCLSRSPQPRRIV